MSRLGSIIKWGIVLAGLTAGWRGYQHFLDQGAPLERGRSAMVRSDYDTAIQHLQVAYQQDPDDLTICLDLAECCSLSGQERDALAWYRRADPLLKGESSTISLIRHKQRYSYLSQKSDWDATSVQWRGARRR